MRLGSCILLALLLGFAHESAAQGLMPAREQQLIDIYLAARNEYEAHYFGHALAQIRMMQETRVARFMGNGRQVKGWVGTVHANDRLADGSLRLSIEIAPRITIATWQNREVDNGDGTLIRPTSPLFATIKKLQFGQKVIFDATIILGHSAPDAEMVEAPELIAIFTRIKPLDAGITKSD